MKKNILFVLLLFLSIHPVLSQVVLKGKVVHLQETHSERLQPLLNNYQVFDIDLPKLHNTVENIDTEVKVRLILDSIDVVLTIIPNEIRAVQYQHAKNGIVYPVDSTTEKCITYKGFVNGNRQENLRLTITDSMLEGYITYNNKVIYIDQLNGFGFQNPSLKNNLIVYRKNDIKQAGGYCGVSSSQEEKYLSNQIHQKIADAPFSSSCKIVELATDADYEWYQRYDSNANKEILSIINSMEAVQTPANRKEKLMDHYVDIIKKNSNRVLSYTHHLAVDGYFMKKSFIIRSCPWGCRSLPEYGRMPTCNIFIPDHKSRGAAESTPMVEKSTCKI